MFRPRSTERRPRDTSLVWPILLIVPPVIILSVVALYSLREDHAAIDRDARRSAAALATDLARRWGARAGTELATLIASACSGGGLEAQGPTDASGAGLVPLCGLVVDGRIRVPFDYPALPSPPGWLRELTPAQARLWRLVADASPQTDLATLRRMVAPLSGAPSAVRVNAEWHVVRAEVNRDPSPRAAARLADLAKRSVGILSESGTPLSDLALLLALRHLPARELPEALLQDLRQRLVESPSFLSSALVEEAVRVAPGNTGVAGLSARWAANERALALLRHLPLDAERPAEVWLGTEQRAWVALVHPLVASDAGSAPAPRTAFQVTLVPARLIERVFQAAASERDDIPKYAAATLRLGDRTWGTRGAPSASTRPIELASARGQIDLPLAVPSDAVSTFAGELLRIAPQAITARQETPGGVVRLNGVPGGHPFTVVLELTDPDQLYASYRIRLWMAIGLILTATLAAFGGLAATWRAFERQRRLGEMKSNFVASVSHELRAPIASVRLMAESLERGTIQPGERQQEYLRVMGQECRRLSSLVGNVLDFSRIDRGRRQYTFEPADLPALLAQTVDVMRPYAAERHVNLVCAAPPGTTGMGQPRVDREALQQALVNLVDNAIKHSPSGADVVVGLEADPNASGQDAGVPARIRLFVDDHGPGIPAGEQERIFEPFYRRGSELRRETQGIGIGLSIVKHIAEAHGGRVVVRSSPGAGSRFAIELPGPTEAAS